MESISAAALHSYRGVNVGSSAAEVALKRSSIAKAAVADTSPDCKPQKRQAGSIPSAAALEADPRRRLGRRRYVTKVSRTFLKSQWPVYDFPRRPCHAAFSKQQFLFFYLIKINASM